MRIKTSIYTEKDVIDCLRKHPGTITSISKELSLNYYTVRNTIRELQGRNIVRTKGYRDRHEIFELDQTDAPKHTIPYLLDQIKGEYIKANAILATVGHEDSMKVVKAVKELPSLVTRLFMLAHNFSHKQDMNNNSTKLKLLHKEMTTNYDIVRNTEQLYKQILQDPKFWDSDFLSDMAEDVDFDSNTILKAYKKIYNQTPELTAPDH